MDKEEKEKLLRNGFMIFAFMQKPEGWKNPEKTMLFAIKVPDGFSDSLRDWYNHPSMKEVVKDINLAEMESKIASDIFLLGITTLFSDERVNEMMIDNITGVFEYGLKKETSGR